MAVAPSLRSAFNSVAVTGTNPTSASITFAVNECQAGDLIVVSWTSTAAPSGSLSVPTATVSGSSVATLTQDSTVNDGARTVYVWSGICNVSPGSSQVVITLSSIPANSGTRRLTAMAIQPGTGQRWNSTRIVRTIAATTIASANPWTVSWGATTSNTNPQFPFMAYIQSGNATQTLDWGDGNGAVSDTSPNASALFHFWAKSSSSSAGYATNTLASTSTVSFGSSAAALKAFIGVLYAVADAAEARGNIAAKGSGRYTLIHRTEARGRAAAKGTGQGYRYTGTKTASGRGNAAAKGSAIPHPKTATGVGRAAADGWSEGLRIKPSDGRGRAAAKGSARFTVGHRSAARGNAAAKGSGAGRKIIPLVSSGRGNVASVGHAFGKYPYHPVFLADFTNTLILDDGSTTTIMDNIGVTITHIVDDGHTTTLES